MQDLYDKLAPARRRLKIVQAIRYVGSGLVAGALVAAVLAVASSLFAMPFLRLLGWGAFAGGPVVAWVLAQLSQPTWSAVAGAVDIHFRLDDRTRSAVTFLEQGKLGGLYAMQINDTLSHLADLDTASAVEVKLPKPLAVGAGWAVVAAVLLFYLPTNKQSAVTENSDSESQSPQSSQEPKSEASPLPENVTWQPATNGPMILVPEDISSVSPRATVPGRVTTSTEILDARMSTEYRADKPNADRESK